MKPKRLRESKLSTGLSWTLWYLSISLLSYVFPGYSATLSPFIDLDLYIQTCVLVYTSACKRRTLAG